jgi:acyl-CoA thioesterase-1
MNQSVKFVLLNLLLWLSPQVHADQRAILVLGDSLSAGYAMRLEQAWPSLLEKRLASNGHQYRVVNSSISGETTQGALARLPRLLSLHEPDIVIIELGGNDGLRGISIDVTRQNFIRMIEASRAAGARVVLTGIMLPPNYGQTYTERFKSIYTELADSYNLPLVPFLLDGVALDPALMLEDGIHPNATAQPRLLDNVWPILAPVLEP